MKFISHQVIYSTKLTSGQKALLEKLLSPQNGYEVSLEFNQGTNLYALFQIDALSLSSLVLALL
jgi:hypothetical protein